MCARRFPGSQGKNKLILRLMEQLVYPNPAAYRDKLIRFSALNHTSYSEFNAEYGGIKSTSNQPLTLAKSGSEDQVQQGSGPSNALALPGTLNCFSMSFFEFDMKIITL
ncbi:hypothetical protein RHSIM_Rhsim07G0177600 [Rhododendron simsii]|uniref:Uncharacterized protein n=1 Tax=Rhododendron simsii TaxID=118357 RepID=A0A834GT85_RHOSS|nr:hypothetical protein RHSIM_Rhsim07G0177600 [Rhododendron simsii]